jgi:dTDP-4-amino-4,6-dideoxygalactose transaminase
MAVAAVGATPVFVDVDPTTLLLTGDHVRAALTDRTVAVVPVHLYGQMVDMEDLMAAAGPAGLFVLEDAAQAHGAAWRGEPPGFFGDAAAFSFYPGKNLGALGDAGAVVLDDSLMAERIRLLSSHGRSRANRFQHLLRGRNSRLDGLQAAVLSVKLRRLDDGNAARRRAHARYVEQLAGSGIELVTVAESATAVHHVEAALLPNRDEVAAALRDAGIETNQHYPVPCHHHAAFADHNRLRLPAVEGAACRELSLPMGPHLALEDVDHVCEQLRRVV